MPRTREFECVVIGAGPGGLVSALYLRRYKRSIALIDHGVPRARWIPRIRNLVAHTEGLTGPELLLKLRRQIVRLGTEIVQGEARIQKRRSGFRVDLNGDFFLAKKVILATGMEDLQPPVANWPELRALGALAYCPICDGYDHSDEPIALIADSPHGLAKIRFIAKFTPRLHVVVIRDFKIPKKFLKDVEHLGLKLYQGRLERLESCRSPRGLRIHLEGQSALEVRLGYVALGSRVRDSAFAHLEGLRRTNEGFLTVSTHQETSIPGLYAVGDCVNALSQVSVAVGHAAIAATHVHNSLGY